MLSNQSSPTPLEPCRIAPYVNVPALRNANSTPAAPSSTQTFTSATAGFSPFDPALLTAAHQVTYFIIVTRNSPAKLFIYFYLTFFSVRRRY